MNKLIIPPPVSSYLSNIIVCAHDDTVIYGSGRALVFIKPTPENEPNDVQILANAHSSHIISVNINPDWRAGNKYVVTICSNDFIVKIWDVETLQRKFAFKHVPLGDGATAVAASFSGQNRIISVTSEGTVSFWRYLTGENSSFQLRNPKGMPFEITCMSVCPHAMWMVAFGLKNGHVMVTDMRNPGKVLHFLRGHSSMVLSLVWCPAPVNIFPVKPHNKVVEKTQAPRTQTDAANEIEYLNSPISSEPSDDKKSNRRKQNNPKKEPSSWTDSHFLDEETRPGMDKKCSEQNLDKKNKITKTKTLSKFLDKKNISQSPSLEEWLSSQTLTGSSDNMVEPQRTKIEPNPQDITNMVSTLDSSKDTSIGDAVLEENTMDVSCNSGSSQGCSINVAEAVENTIKYIAESSKDISESETMDIDSNLADSQDSFVKGTENTTKDTSGREVVLEKDTTMDVACNPNDSQSPSVNAAITENITKIAAEILEETSGGEMDLGEDTTVHVACSSDDSQGSLHRFTENTTKDSPESSKNTSGGEVVLEENTTMDIAGNSGCSEGPSASTIDGENGCEPEQENWRTRKPVVVEEEEPRREFLLASSAKESNIYIWRAGTDGRLQTFLSLPKQKRHAAHPKKQPWSGNEKEWIVLCWVTPNVLLSSTSNAELVEWKLPRPLTDEKYPYVIHTQHNGVLYTISSPMVYLNEYSFLQKRSVNVWTTGKDRSIVNMDLSTRKVLTRYPGWGGCMNLIVGSPLDPNRLAMAMSKNYHFFTWSMDQPHTKDIKFTTYSVNKGVITTLAWHPDIETLLAWGTEDGVIGTFDVSRKQKNPKRYFSTPVYKVQWGPVDSTTKNRKLFTVCDRKIVVFDIFTDKKDFIKTELDLEISVYTMGWKPDFTMMLVSGKNGEVLELNPNLEVTSKKYTPEVVQTIHWHPHAVSSDHTTSKYYKTFVSIIKHTKIYVFDLSIEEEFYKNKIIKSYDNKEVKISDVAWNPHSGNQLVMVDNHGIAWVYDIDGPVVSTYINPYVDAISSVIWSPLDPDYVIVATYSNLIIWKISENPPLTPEAVQSQRSKLETKQKKEANHLKTKDDDQLTDNRVKPKSQNYLVLPKFYPYRKNITMSDMKLLLDWKLGNLSPGESATTSDILQIFGDSGNAKDIYKLSELHFQSGGDRNRLNLLRLFRGDPTEIVQEAIDKKLVTPWIITIAPMASPQLYLEACKTYVDQLEVEPNADPLEVTTYMLITHQFQRCIKYLCERQLFREALMLAKDKFGTFDPIMEEILRKYGDMCMFGGNFELAACCYIALGDFHKAAAVLYRREDLFTLKMALELAALTDNKDLYSAVNLRYLDAELRHKEKIAAKPNDVPEGALKSENETAVEMLGLDVQTSMAAHLLADMENGYPKAIAEQVKKDIENKAANLEGKSNGLFSENTDQPDSGSDGILDVLKNGPSNEADDNKLKKQESDDIDDVIPKLEKVGLSESERPSSEAESPNTESKKNDVHNYEMRAGCTEQVTSPKKMNSKEDENKKTEEEELEHKSETMSDLSPEVTKSVTSQATRVKEVIEKASKQSTSSKLDDASLVVTTEEESLKKSEKKKIDIKNESNDSVMNKANVDTATVESVTEESTKSVATKGSLIQSAVGEK